MKPNSSIRVNRSLVITTKQSVTLRGYVEGTGIKTRNIKLWKKNLLMKIYFEHHDNSKCVINSNTSVKVHIQSKEKQARWMT